MADLRMPDINKVFLAGRLTRDPELRYLQSGTPVCDIALAVSRKFRDKDGNMQEEVLFIDATCWSKTAEFVGENFKKGRSLVIEGRLKSDSWETEDGKKRNKVFVNADRVQSLDWESSERREETTTSGGASSDVPEDDIPF